MIVFLKFFVGSSPKRKKIKIKLELLENNERMRVKNI